MAIKVDFVFVLGSLFTLLIISEARRLDGLSYPKILTLQSYHSSNSKNVVVKRQIPDGSDPLHNNQPSLTSNDFNIVVKKVSPSGPDPIHNHDQPPLVPKGFNIIVKRQSPSGPDPIHNHDQPPLVPKGFNIIVKRQSPSGPDPIHNHDQLPLVPKVDPQKITSIILGGGPGTHLFPLIKRAATPAVPVGGCYKLIDIPMSNCIDNGIKKIFVLTWFNSAFLNRHITCTYYGNGISFG
ncbi:hypothetical protein GQ457_17G021130 [Hibiscus cannabinus]